MSDESDQGHSGGQQQVGTTIVMRQAALEVSKVTGQPPPTPPPSTTESGDFTFTDPDELAAITTQWKDHWEAIQADLLRIQEARALAGDFPVAHDSASAHFHRSMTESLESLERHNRDMAAYAELYIEKLEQARGLTVDNDSDAATGLSGGI